MTDYFLRNLTPRTYQIAKFEDTKEPTEIYTVTENLKTGFMHCNCPGFRRNQSQDHKHIVMATMLTEYGWNYFNEDYEGERLEFLSRDE